MDPDTTWNELLSALEVADDESAKLAAESLSQWLREEDFHLAQFRAVRSALM